jgi:lysyl-tRNA synthetase class 1
VALTEDKALLWSFVQRYAPDTSPETHPGARRADRHAAAYFREFVKMTLKRRAPDAREAEALRDLDARLAQLPSDATR